MLSKKFILRKILKMIRYVQIFKIFLTDPFQGMDFWL